MAYSESMTRAYVEKRFPRASDAEHERLVVDWLTKPEQAEGIATDFERRVRPLVGLRVLDAGCGNGGISIAFTNSGAIVEGVDVEEDLIAIARTEATNVGSSVHFTCYDGITLPFPDNSFDAVISVSVLEHVDKPVRYLSEILRVLKPKGVLYLAFPNRLNPREAHTRLWGLTYLPLLLAHCYVHLTKHNPLKDNGIHFYTFWDAKQMLHSSEFSNRTWIIREEKGISANPLKILLKRIVRLFGIPHQAFLPHVMLILEAQKTA